MTTMSLVRACSFMVMMMLQAAAASRPAVGSSRKRTNGFLAMAMPMLALRRWPPEHPGMNWFPSLVCWQPSNPILCRRLSTKAFFSASLSPEYKFTAICISSLGVRKGQ
mmetsp:Transcript_14506/g.27481  ORF Transcript_14506/g.27481 Transcript_14506/m.27481 type:complete len:109 (+) Transcript_14506:275-601(+)